MNTFLIIVSCFILLYFVIAGLEFFIGLYFIPKLDEQSAEPNTDLPKVSIIVPTLNEADSIENTVLKLLQLNYPNYELIVVDDRSTDSTPDILKKLAIQYPQLRVQRIDQLPPQWLGKNHALHQGAKLASGDWLLFTDADTSMEKTALTRAIHYANDHKCDHIVIYEKHIYRSFTLNLLLFANYINYYLVLKPWRVGIRRSKASLGAGVFNLLRRPVYDAIGGHQAIALECIDDMMLGKIVKQHGFKQHNMDNSALIQRAWYASLPDMIAGLEKNGFAYFKFRIGYLLFGTIMGLLLYFTPIILAVTLYGSWLFWLNLTTIILTLLICTHIAKYHQWHYVYIFFYPISQLLLLYALWNSAIKVLSAKGVVWRDTYYPLTLLKHKSIPRE